MAVAIYRSPQVSRKRRRKPLSAAGVLAMQAAALALTDAVPALVGDDALAERERLRSLDEARGTAQGVLSLVCAPSPRVAADAEERAVGSVGAGGIAARSGSPVDGSSLGPPVAGSSDPDSCVDSGRGRY